MKLFRDLFTGPGGANYELARFLAAWAVLTYGATFIGVFIRGGQPMDFSAIGTGYGIVLAGAGALIWAKDTARTAAISQVTKDETAAVVAAAPPVQPVVVVNDPAKPVPVVEGDGS